MSEISRRRLLSAAATASAVVGLAGCQEPADEEQKFDSDSAILSEAGVRRMGFADGSHEEYTFENRETVGDETVEATITNSFARYTAGRSEDARSHDRANELSLGVVTTPSAKMLNREMNPYVSLSPGDFLQSEQGKRLVGRLGGPSDFEWVGGFDEYGERDQVELLGETVPLRTFVGIVESSDGREVVVTYLARATSGDDVVIVSGYKGIPVEDDFEGPVVRAAPDLPGPDLAGQYVPPADIDPGHITRDAFEAGRVPDAESREDPLEELETQTRGEDYGFFDDEIDGPVYEILIIVIPDVVLVPHPIEIIPCFPPAVNPTHLRLVQTVEDSKVNAEDAVVDIPPVYGDYTAALFSLEVDGDHPDCLPEKLVGKVTRTMADGSTKTTPTSGFTFDREDQLAYLDPDLDPDKDADHRKVWSEYAREDDSWFPVWALDEDVVEVEVTIETVAGTELGSASIERGEDWAMYPDQFGVLEVQPLKVGFIRVRDDDDVERYGWESSAPEILAYRRAVETAVDYIRANFPGGVVAYRTDSLIYEGGSGMGSDHSSVKNGMRDVLTGDHGVEEFEDHNWWDLGAILYSHHFSNWVEAGQEIADADGFDAVVMIVPSTDPNNTDAHAECDDEIPPMPYGNYYHYHYGTECPGDEGEWTGGLAYREAEGRAVSVISSAGDEWYHPNELRIAEIVAHELGHYFDTDQYGALPDDDYPFAMRRGEGDGDESLNGVDADFQHANGDLDQYGFDLRGKTFRTVHRPDTDGTDLVQSAHGSNSVERYQSFMTYTNNRTWADSIIFASLARSQYNWDCNHDGGLNCITEVTNMASPSMNFSGVAPPGSNFDAQEHGHEPRRQRQELLTANVVLDEEGQLAVEKYRLIEGILASPPPGEEVEVSLLTGPDGDSLASRTHPRTVGTYGGYEPEGMFVDFEFPFERGGTHLHVAVVGEQLTENVFEGVLSSTIDQLDPEATTQGVEAELSRRVEQIGAYVDERAYEAALEMLLELEMFVEGEVEQIDPIVEEIEGRTIADLSTTTRNNFLDQIRRLQRHLREMK